MPVLKATEGEGVKIEPGIYAVTCFDAKEDKLDNSKFGDGHVIRLDLEIASELDNNENPVRLDAIANFKLTPSSKLWEWAEAFGCTPVLGDDFDTDCLIGKQAQAVVINKASEKEGGGTFSRVDKIVPMPKGSRGNGGSAPKEVSVIKADGSWDSDVFWREVNKAGLNRSIVTDHVGGDIDTLMEMDGPAAQAVLDELKEKAAATP